MRLRYKKQRGFTLIELIVVMAVFLFIIGAAIGIFLSIVQQQKRVLSEQEFLSQISYVEEYMSKALRMAAADTSGSCLDPNYIYLLKRQSTSATVYTGIEFFNQSDGTCQEFFLDTDGILKELNITKGGSAVPLISTNLQINSVRFSINGSDGSVLGQGCSSNPDQCGALNTDAAQPRVTILLNVSIPGEEAKTIQTTVSQRYLNVKQ